MQKKLINKCDLSLPFIVVVMAAALFLSGCNLNAGARSTTSSSHEPTSMTNTKTNTNAKTTSEVIAKDLAEPVTNYQAGAIQTFDQQKFDAAVADGETVFLDFYATWCPTCRVNEPIVNSAFDGSHDVVGFRVDYDNETELKKKYSVISQSTYLVLKDGNEVDRYLGSLTPSRMAILLGV